MSKYNWALNPLKLNRAIGEVSEDSEAALKAEYIRIGGKVPEVEIEEVPVEIHVEVPEAPVVEEVTVPVAEELPKVEEPSSEGLESFSVSTDDVSNVS